MDTLVIPASGAEPRRAAGRSAHRLFYVSVALAMTAMVVIGFWPSYFGPVARGTYAGSWVFHLHGLVFMGWMGLLVAQVALVAAGRTRMHRRVGTAGIAYGVLVLIVGLGVSFYSPVMHIANRTWTVDQAAAFLLLPLGDMALFGGFFGAAIRYRRQPEIHKRLMLLATIALAFAAVFRRVPADQPATFLAIWLAPLAAAMAYDWRTRGRVHPTYVIGLVVCLVAFARVFAMNRDAWLSIGRALLASAA